MWTRSLIDHSELIGAGDAVLSLVTPRHKWTLVEHALTPDIVDAASLLRVSFSGEPLQELGVLFLREGEDGFDPSAEVLNWIACRWMNCNSMARRFFLLLDLETHDVLLKSSPPFPGQEHRLSAIDAVGKKCFARLVDRLEKGAAIRKVAPEPLSEVADLLARLLWVCFGEHTDAMVSAFDDFAAGVLRHNCKTLHPRLRPARACDADSANVFLFTELALAVLEHKDLDKAWRSRAVFWGKLLAVFVRMQHLYLLRFKDEDRQCFATYVTPDRGLSKSEIEDVRGYYEGLSDTDLIQEYLCHLRRVARDYPGCFRG